METSTAVENKKNGKVKRGKQRREEIEWLAALDSRERPPVEITHRIEQGKGLATGLGWFSVGLGVTQLVVPGLLSRAIGIKRPDTTTDLIMRACGARELVAGVGLLSGKRRKNWLQARVVGDALDLGLLVLAMTRKHNSRARLGVATLAVAAVTVLDLIATQKAMQEEREQANTPALGASHVGRAITIAASPDEVYAMWRDLARLPRFMPHLIQVTPLDERRSEWVSRGPAGTQLKWQAEIVEDQPGRLLSWRSLDGSRVWNSGSVRFLPAPGGRGTEVVVELHYRAPAGVLGRAVATMFGLAPTKTIDTSLRHLKQIMELGEVVRSDASIHAGMHPARPSVRARTLIGGVS